MRYTFYFSEELNHGTARSKWFTEIFGMCTKSWETYALPTSVSVTADYILHQNSHTILKFDACSQKSFNDPKPFPLQTRKIRDIMSCKRRNLTFHSFRSTPTPRRRKNIKSEKKGSHTVFQANRNNNRKRRNDRTNEEYTKTHSLWSLLIMAWDSTASGIRHP